MLQTILWLLGMYFAVIGLISTVAILVELLWPPTPPRGCRLFLQVEEDADYTESGLTRCHRLLSRQETGGLPYTVLLPREGEAREICRRYCRDWQLDTLDLPRAPESTIIKPEPMEEKDGEPQGQHGTGDGEDSRDGGGDRLSQ